MKGEQWLVRRCGDEVACWGLLVLTDEDLVSLWDQVCAERRRRAREAKGKP